MPERMVKYWSKEVEMLKNKNSMSYKIKQYIKENISTLLLYMTLCIMVSVLIINNNNTNKFNELEKNVTARLVSMGNQNKALSESLRESQVEIIEEVNKNVDLIKKNEELIHDVDNIDLYKSTYKYVMSTEGYETDITNSDLIYGVNKMNSEKIDPHLLFGIIMAESNGKAKLVDKELDRHGYGQITHDTARWMYEVQLYNGENSYKEEMIYDGKKNMEMTAEYISYLIKKNDGSVYKACIDYGGDVEFFHSVNSIIINSSDTNLKEIGEKYKKDNKA